jgi:hypothetical protein
MERNLRIVAYEFATMGSLHDILHGMITRIHHTPQLDRKFPVLIWKNWIGTSIVYL